MDDEPLPPPTPEEEKAEAWEYWHQRARKLEVALLDMLADLDDPDLVEISAATITRARQALAGR